MVDETHKYIIGRYGDNTQGLKSVLRRTPIESIQRAAGTRAKREAKEFHSINRTLREKFELNLQFSINYWPASHDTVLIRLWALLNHHQLEIAEK